MNKKTLEDFQKKLEQEKLEIILRLKKADDEIDQDGDEVDKIQAKILATIEGSLGNRIKDKLTKIDLALAKIKKGTYGSCQDCEEDISEKRLMANPYGQLCLSCAEDREEPRKQAIPSKKPIEVKK